MSGNNFGIWRPPVQTASAQQQPTKNEDWIANFGIYRPTGPQQEPTKKEDFTEFVQELDNYVPSIPDEVTKHFLSLGGFATEDPRIVRFMSIAAQKHISDVVGDAMLHCKVRVAKEQAEADEAGAAAPDKTLTMTMEDLQPALQANDITAFKPPYYK